MSDLDKYMYINILDFNKKCHVHILTLCKNWIKDYWIKD